MNIPQLRAFICTGYMRKKIKLVRNLMWLSGKVNVIINPGSCFVAWDIRQIPNTTGIHWEPPRNIHQPVSGSDFSHKVEAEPLICQRCKVFLSFFSFNFLATFLRDLMKFLSPMAGRNPRQDWEQCV